MNCTAGIFAAVIVEVSRGHIKVEVNGRRVTVPGEMFFSPNGKVGFAVFGEEITAWDRPHHLDPLSEDDVRKIIESIRQDFAKGGHTLEVWSC